MFIEVLARRILEEMDAVIITGGFRHSGENPDAISTDVAALRGARRFAHDTGRALRDCFEAWIPEPSLDSRPDVRGAVRMSEQEDGITVRVMAGRTPLGRRLAMVADVDVVLTISGRRHTEVVMEQALELGLPVLPIPDAGGDSKELLQKHRTRIAAGFDAGALDLCLKVVADTMKSQPKQAADAVVELLRSARIGRCLLLFPYDEEHDRLYASVIRPAVEEHMFPIRLDRRPRSDAIYSSFAEAIRSSSAVIIDITKVNENVMYEAGYAHGHGSGLPLLIYARKAARLKKLPLYFRTLNVQLAEEPAALKPLVDGFLQSVKGRRQSS
jgi:hypothetical protein